jgi:hypothetical protein
MEERDQSEEVQSHLHRVLNGQGLPGQGQGDREVDPATLAWTAKRREAVARLWPSLSKALGNAYEPLFAAYAAKVPPPVGGVKKDARAFLRQLKAKGKVPDQLAVTLLTDAMTGWPMRIARLRERRGVAVAVRLPKMGIRVWSLSLGARK